MGISDLIIDEVEALLLRFTKYYPLSEVDLKLISMIKDAIQDWETRVDPMDEHRYVTK